MDWYFIVLIIIAAVIIITLLISFICFKIVFYTKNKKTTSDEIILPNNKFYQTFKNEIIKDIQDARKLDYKLLSIESFDGLKLFGKYYEFNKDFPIEIMIHGYRGNSERDLSTGIRRAKLCNHNVLLIDQRGSGLSEGHVISFGINEYKDCLSWIKYCNLIFGNEQKIILTGISMGAATVLMTSNQDLPKNVIGILADCGFSSPKDIIKKVIKEMKLPTFIFYPFIFLGARIYGRFNLHECSPEESVKKANKPILFIHGSDDSFVPSYMSELMYQLCNSEKQLLIVDKADHGVAFLVNEEKYVKVVNKFFNDK